MLRDPARLESFQPHMHLRGKAMSMEAILPDGTVRTLSNVDHFDFNWMNNYIYSDEDAPVLPRGHETVLAVEDNRALRRILVRQLQDLGYRVLEAEDAKSAIAILDRENDVDLLFTDIVLPGGVNGSELARMAAAMRAELKVLFTSGFPEAAFGPGGALPTGASLLVKPYRKDELAQRLRESLAA